MTKKESIHLTVTDLAYKGQGIAHHQGKVFFIDDVVPGDQVLVENHHDHGSWAQAPERTMVQPSPLRQKSPCIYSSSCGGCQWLELPYPEQLRWKAAFIRDALQRVGKITYEQAIEVAGSPDQLHYRNRILLRGRINETGNISVGFFRKNSRDLIAVEQCMIADGELNKLIAHLQKLTIAAPPQKFRLAAQVVELAKRENKPCLLITLHPVEGAHKGLKKLVAALQAFPLTLWCGLQEELKHKLHLFPFEGPAEQPFYTAPEQFQQVNLRQNEAMRALVDQTVAGGFVLWHGKPFPRLSASRSAHSGGGA
jgi:23S rRNA (uracil1939-C5)-methyltransferase